MVSDRQDGAATAAPSDKKTGENYFDESGEYLSDADSRVGAGFLPPRGLETLAPSRLARSQSIWSCSRNRRSIARCSRCHTPAACQSRRRRQHVMPLPKPSSCGRSFHGIPVCSTYRMPLSAARSSTVRRRPPLGDGENSGIRGSSATHNSLLILRLAMQRTIRRMLHHVQVVLAALNCLTFSMLTGDIEALAVRLSAKKDVFYEETVQATYQKGCSNAVKWLDSFVGGNVTVCLTSPLFPQYGGPISRLSIVHSLRGPLGIRVLTVHAVDSEPGRIDISQMQTNPATH